MLHRSSSVESLDQILRYRELSGIVLDRLTELLDSITNKSYASNLIDAMKYSCIDPDAKRLRPVLFLLFIELFGVDLSSAVDFACAIEMIHCYSVVHDDLPGMDNDDYRRGKLAVHKKFDEGTAILVGDAFLTMSFGVISKAPLLGDSTKVELIKMVSDYIGPNGMVLGQALDISLNDDDISDILSVIHIKKTASLFCVAVCAAGLIVGADTELMKILEQFGLCFGVMFQISDDFGDSDELTTANIVNREGASAANSKLLALRGELYTLLGSIRDILCQRDDMSIDFVNDILGEILLICNTACNMRSGNA